MSSEGLMSWAEGGDRAFYDRELAGFVPDRVFDAHAHLWHPQFTRWPVPATPRGVGLAQYMYFMRDLHGERTIGSLFLPSFSDGSTAELERENGWVSDQIKGRRNLRGHYFVRPGDDPAHVGERVAALGLCGLKCYHMMADQPNTMEASIPAYLPESLVRLANENGWSITLHMVKARAVAEGDNIRWIRHYCKTYPNMHLILAHSARGFQPGHNLEGLVELADLENLYFDTSANCEPIAHEAIMRIVGHRRILYGTDFPISHMRGRSVAAGDSFVWLYEDNPVWQAGHRSVRPVLVGLEHLRSLKWACWSQRLSDAAVEDIFWNNAAGLFGLDSVG